MPLYPPLRFPDKLPGQFHAAGEFNLINKTIDSAIEELQVIDETIRTTPLVEDFAGVEYEFPSENVNPRDGAAINVLRLQGQLITLSAKIGEGTGGETPTSSLTYIFSETDYIHVHHPGLVNPSVTLYDSNGATFRGGTPQRINLQGLQDANWTFLRWMGRLSGKAVFSGAKN